jgi:hypothetical protein
VLPSANQTLGEGFSLLQIPFSVLTLPSLQTYSSPPFTKRTLFNAKRMM